MSPAEEGNRKQEAPANASQSSASAAGTPKSPIRRLAAWVAEHVGATLLGIAVTAAIAAGGALLFSKGSVGKQLDDLRGSLSEQGFTVHAYRTATFHPGAKSHVFVLGDPNSGKPDHLRIYDDADSSLHLAFTLDPDAVTQRGNQYPAHDLHLLSLKDVTGDGQKELVFTYVGFPYLRVPMAVGWNAERHKYEVGALLRSSVLHGRYPPLGAPRDYLFRRPFSIRTAGGAPISAWPAQSVAIADNPYGEGAVLAAAVPSSRFPQIQIGFWGLSPPPPLASTKPIASYCWQELGRTSRFLQRLPRGLNPEALLRNSFRQLVVRDRLTRAGALPENKNLLLGIIVSGDCLVGE